MSKLFRIDHHEEIPRELLSNPPRPEDLDKPEVQKILARAMTRDVANLLEEICSGRLQDDYEMLAEASCYLMAAAQYLTKAGRNHAH